jgi:hypothetical protein
VWYFDTTFATQYIHMRKTKEKEEDEEVKY